MADLKAEVGDLIRHHRRARGWTQEQLAEKAGRTIEWINRLERGKAEPSFETLQSLSQAFRIPIRDLFGIGPHAVGDDNDALAGIVHRASVLSPEELAWLARLVDVALARRD